MKIRRILVGTDFSGEAEIALEHAVRIARHVGAELLLAHAGSVIDTADAALAPESAALLEYERIVAQHVAENREHLAQLVDRVRSRGVDASEQIVEGFPDTGISEAADELDADLVVIGTHGRTGLKRLLLGSVAERVVRLCRRHVMVARPTADGEAAGYRRILVPTDFSPRAELALEIALELADPAGEVELLHAWSLPALTGSLVPSRASESALEPVRASLAAGARDKGEALIARHPTPATVALTIVNDQAARAIGERAATGHDLIVMGGHGRRGLRRLILGSVAEATVRHAPCSVLVVHELPGAGASPGATSHGTGRDTRQRA
ncbi:MAG TPA: universal stress protein [Kofleriaceae bacterium]|nr:universal stress protein [Kofleriaceae bacterium]